MTLLRPLLFLSCSVSFSSSAFCSVIPPPPSSTLFPYTTLFRSVREPSRLPAGASAIDCRCFFCSRILTRVKILLQKKQRRSEEHTSELQSLTNLVCRLLLEKKKADHQQVV